MPYLTPVLLSLNQTFDFLSAEGDKHFTNAWTSSRIGPALAESVAAFAEGDFDRVCQRLYPIRYFSTLRITNEESNSVANSNGRKFLYNSKGLDVISLLVKYYVPLAHFNKVIKLLKFTSAVNLMGGAIERAPPNEISQ